MPTISYSRGSTSLTASSSTTAMNVATIATAPSSGPSKCIITDFSMRTTTNQGKWHYQLSCRSNGGTNIGTPIIDLAYITPSSVKGVSPHLGVMQGNKNTATSTTASYYMPPVSLYEGATFYDAASNASDIISSLTRLTYGEVSREFYVCPSDTLVFGAYEGNAQTIYVYYSFIWITE